MTARAATVRSRQGYQFLSALGPLRRSLRRVHDRELAPLGISSTQAYPIILIGEHDGIRQGELAERLDVEGPTLVRVLDQLGAMGLVQRRPDPNDSRAKTLHLTPSGEQLAGRLRPVLEALRARLLADVSAHELDVCLRVFGTLQAAIEREVAGGSV